jgi:polyisoprenoid-binding protein YceI
MSKLVKIIVAAVGLLVVAAFVVPKVVANLRDDEDLEAELPEVSTTAAPGTISVSNTSTGEPSTSSRNADDPSGTWTLVTGDRATYFVGYQIEETLRGEATTATGTTGTYTGSLTLADQSLTTLELAVDMTTLESDEGFRDDSIRSEGLETTRFPEAGFIVTEPVALSRAPTIGEPINLDVTGDLTLHGVTKTRTVAVEARWNGDTIDVTGEIPITLADYSIVAPRRPFVSVRDRGKVVFVVQFARG